MPYPGKGLKAEVDESTVRNIVTPLVADAASTQARQVVNFKVDGVATIADLRNRVPAYNGERVFVKQYRAPSVSTMAPAGGGWFTGKTSSTGVVDDNGYRFKATTGYWQRDKDIHQLEVFDFGAMGDAVTDDGDAFQWMHEFMNGTYAKSITKDRSVKIGIRVGPGSFLVSPRSMQKYGSVLAANNSEYPYYPEFDGVRYGAASDFILQSTVLVDYGTQLATRIISTKVDTPVFQINARRFCIRGIEFDGQQTTKQDKFEKTTNPTGTNMLIGATRGVYNDTASNKQPFLINYCAGGTYANVSHFRVANTGGYGIYYFDSLDSLFNQIYSANTADNVLKFGWTNREPGGWNHSTAVKITNCNFQTAMAPCIWAPRMTQAIMDNVWTEHGCVPWDLNNGQWNMNCISIEDFTQPAVMWNCRALITNYSDPTGVKLDFTSKPGDASYVGYQLNPDGSAITNAVSGFEQGDVRIQNYGAYFNCPVRVGFFSGTITGKTNEVADEWVNIGSIELPDIGTHVHITIMSRNEYGSTGSTTTASAPTNDRAPGYTHIKVSRANSNVAAVTYHMEGAAGITEVLLENTTFNTVLPALWVKFTKTIGSFAMFAYSSGNTRKEAGSWATLTWSGARTTTRPTNVTAAVGMWSAHNGQAGFGFRNDVVSIQSRSTTHTKAAPLQNLADFTKPFKTQLMVINGEDLYVATYAPQPIITTQPPATTAATVGGSFSLSVVATYAARYLWQKSTDAGVTWTDIPSSNLATYTKANLVAGDAGLYRVIVKGKLENADDTVTTNRVISTSTTVTVS